MSRRSPNRAAPSGPTPITTPPRNRPRSTPPALSSNQSEAATGVTASGNRRFVVVNQTEGGHVNGVDIERGSSIRETRALGVERSGRVVGFRVSGSGGMGVGI